VTRKDAAVLAVENLEKQFRVHTLGGKRIDGFADVSFTVARGMALGLAGASGSGKSSVLKCIYRTYLATGGRIRYDSEALGPVEMTALSEHEVLLLRRKEIGYVTQFLSVLPRVPAADVVAEPLVEQGMAPREARRRAETLLVRLGIPDELFDAYPVTFSGGEQQRLNLARGIISRPRLLLLDEPTASLDRRAMETVLELLRELRANGSTMIMVFHDPEIMGLIADDIYAMPAKTLEEVPA
jgi:alpha-D-ribose 1-methylphosphonate 5-triphosphate synthase subunit PhnL